MPKCSNDHTSELVDISVVVPLKGWDLSLEALLNSLCDQNYNAEIEIIVVADKENCERLSAISDNIKVIETKKRAAEWYDKNWRMYQGFEAASFSALLFMDSDTSIDRNYLTRRVKSHKGHLSFSIPLYANAKQPSESLLASFTDYSNFSLYAGGFIWCQFNTAIGPSMLIHPVDHITQEALYNNRKEASDDHSLGTYYGRKGKKVHLSNEPIVVNKYSASFTDVIEQIIRWLMLPRAIMHLIDRKTFAYSFSMLILSLLAPILIYVLIILTMVYTIPTTYFIALLLGICIEGIGLMINEYRFLNGSHTLPKRHLVYVPLMLMLQPVLMIISFFRKQFIWRGITVALDKWMSK
ncbi:MAG: glycosyltransferase family 2 protein [Reichenbachiella sp.]